MRTKVKVPDVNLRDLYGPACSDGKLEIMRLFPGLTCVTYKTAKITVLRDHQVIMQDLRFAMCHIIDRNTPADRGKMVLFAKALTNFLQEQNPKTMKHGIVLSFQFFESWCAEELGWEFE